MRDTKLLFSDVERQMARSLLRRSYGNPRWRIDRLLESVTKPHGRRTTTARRENRRFSLVALSFQARSRHELGRWKRRYELVMRATRSHFFIVKRV